MSYAPELSTAEVLFVLNNVIPCTDAEIIQAIMQHIVDEHPGLTPDQDVREVWKHLYVYAKSDFMIS
jgi:hypothetical protein